MAFVMRFARGVRNHWKKSAFAACLLAYGSSWLKGKYDIDELMRVYCERSLRHGQQSIPITASPRTVTVILNPAANRRQALEDFDKYCSPILNLAGICVEVVQTESEGHAKELVQGLSGTDAVVVGGGDGTLSEVITGLLRRTGENRGDAIPVGVLPLGRSNRVSSSLFPGGSHLRKVKSMADAALAIVEESTKPMDVMKIEIIDEESKPVYALAGLEWGAYRDAAARKDKYWYYGPLRKYATYIFNGYKGGLSWKCNAVVSFSPPCRGCSNCSIEREEITSNKWYHKFISSPKNSKLHLVNEECLSLREKEVSTSDLALLTSDEDGVSRLRLQLGPDDVDYLGFVTEGWRTEVGKERTVKEVIEARQMEIRPRMGEEEGWFSIDREDFEVRAVKVTVLPKVIRMFCKKDGG